MEGDIDGVEVGAMFCMYLEVTQIKPVVSAPGEGGAVFKRTQ